MGVDNLAQFEAALDRAQEELSAVVFDAQLAATAAAEEALRSATPRRTGRAQDSIQQGASRIDSNRSIGPIAGAKPFGVTHAFSDLFYFRFVNDGTSKRAGRHMVERAAIVAGDVLQERLR